MWGRWPTHVAAGSRLRSEAHQSASSVRLQGPSVSLVSQPLVSQALRPISQALRLVSQAPRPVSQPHQSGSEAHQSASQVGKGWGVPASQAVRPGKPCFQAQFEARPATGPSLAPPPPSQTCRLRSTWDQLANNGEHLLQGLQESCHFFLKDFITAAPCFLGLL